MRVLHINKFGWPKGGSEVYMLRVLEEQTGRDGLDVAAFAGSPLTLPPGVRGFPVSVPDFHDATGVGKTFAAAHVLWSSKVRAALADVVDTFRPDVAHLHLYAHQLSPSVISLLRSRRVPMVLTAHDLKLVCPAYSAVRKGQDCLACARHLAPVALRDRCLHDSLSWTATALVESAFVRIRSYLPDVVLAPSRYFLEAFRSSWIADRVELRLLRNPAEASGRPWTGEADFLLYVGRLSFEKGVDRLIQWAATAGFELVVAGDGPEMEDLRRLAVSSGGRVTFLGHVDEARLWDLRSSCRAQVLPSRCPDNSPLAALEAVVDGVPLVLTRRGGLPEIVDMGARATLLEPENAEGLRDAVHRVAAMEVDVEQLREDLSLGRHVDALSSVYAAACCR